MMLGSRWRIRGTGYLITALLLMTPSISHASRATFDGLGPLKLGISEDDAEKTFGHGRAIPAVIAKFSGAEAGASYAKKVSFAASTWDLEVFFRSKRVSSYNLSDDWLIYTGPKGYINQDEVERTTFQCWGRFLTVKAYLTRYFFGEPNGTDQVANTIMRADWIDTNHRQVIAYARIFQNRCTVGIAISEPDPKAENIEILPTTK